MKKLRPKDLVFNYRKGYVIGYCIIRTESYLAPQPEEFTVDVEWEDEGFMADADYYLFDKPITAGLKYTTKLWTFCRQNMGH